ncbi:MAG: hypothetical protein N3E41_06800 [Thermofilaceae archaeon]|nr:hypothetical protein [Thermofilaceae archaeon]MDW8004546.1 DNA primase small subunit domain-containing protein [Thermofilaceae archaeon]
MEKAQLTLSSAKGLFQSYYKQLTVGDIVVSSLSKREFAFSYFDEGGMHRHISFEETGKLLNHLRASSPKHVYYSTAYYLYPSAKDMDAKGWEGADLVFDIDVDHIETDCKSAHDQWRCKTCNTSGWGNVKACPHCGGEAIEKRTWVCETCINVARDEVFKLVEMLEMDFGLSLHELFITFSGHRGFHIHVESPAVRVLNQDARRELIDYVKGLGIDIRVMLVKNKGGFKLRYGANSSGWYARISRWALFMLGAEDPVLNLRDWEKIFIGSMKKEAVAIDENVTIDTKRLIRLPNSLHGKTGLKAAPFTVNELEKGEFIEKVKVFSKEEIKISTGGELPKKVLDLEISSTSRTLPFYVALYLMLNGAPIKINV